MSVIKIPAAEADTLDGVWLCIALNHKQVQHGQMLVLCMTSQQPLGGANADSLLVLILTLWGWLFAGEV